ncbi:MAG: fumarylacetoacetate hydrolase family protein [bacterium]|nr:fumarylacetoacetate hydrolase family protein [bacterium]MDD5354381.1 fumarylacetoacetate hydrolase family protein [bacterium]MDD5756432.1 fumarylacetoacetate hydrolase family protein [bacterium]
MKYLRFSHNNEIKYGILEKDDIILELEGDYGSYPGHHKHPLSQCKILMPCLPSKIVAVGLNYTDHAKELKMPVPEEPVLFIKPSTSVIGSGDKIIFPKMCAQLGYEGEVAIVIKKVCRYITPEKANEYILGITCFNDVTARDLQKKDGQWTRAKSFDTFSPLGPFIASGLNLADIAVELRLNGQVKQSASTKNLIFPIPQLVSFISRVMTLLPGDVITTGTPPGVGTMKVGDTVEVTIPGVGTLKNNVIGESNV